MVSSSGNEYVFVRKPRSTASAAHPKEGGTVEKFEKRRIVVAQENHDFVVISRGLKPGEEVATTGSLILAQLFEDAKTVESGVPAE
jgi:cobalt-zinc-cadmium efflux system membrane fusion protein